MSRSNDFFERFERKTLIRARNERVVIAPSFSSSFFFQPARLISSTQRVWAVYRFCERGCKNARLITNERPANWRNPTLSPRQIDRKVISLERVGGYYRAGYLSSIGLPSRPTSFAHTRSLRRRPTRKSPRTRGRSAISALFMCVRELVLGSSGCDPRSADCAATISLNSLTVRSRRSVVALYREFSRSFVLD